MLLLKQKYGCEVFELVVFKMDLSLGLCLLEVAVELTTDNLSGWGRDLKFHLGHLRSLE